MHTDRQFSPGFLTLRDDRDVARLDARLLADVGIERRERGQYERDGVPVDPAVPAPRFHDILGVALGFVLRRPVRHA